MLAVSPDGGAIPWQPSFALEPEGPPVRLALELTYDDLGQRTDVRELHATPIDTGHD